MHLEVFLTLVLLFYGAAFLVIPRNHLFGFKNSKTLSCDYVWARANRLLGILFELISLVLIVEILMSCAMNVFYTTLGLLIALAFIFVNRTSSIDYEYAKKNNFVDFGDDVPVSAPSKKKKSKKNGHSGLTFAASKKFSLMFCLFCAFLIFVSYAWIARSSEFFPQQIFTYYSADNIASGYLERGVYLRFANIAFWLVQIACASVLIVISVFFSKAKFLNRPFSLHVSISEVAFAYAASFAILLALVNYHLLAKNLSGLVGFDYVFSILFGLMLIFSVWTILFVKSARNGASLVASKKRKP